MTATGAGTEAEAVVVVLPERCSWDEELVVEVEPDRCFCGVGVG